ncbi:MAG: pyridoxamine 5'-phosphate oxidase family protein [Dermatophilaceae bacterium]
MSRNLDDARRLVAAEHGLATLATTRRDGTVQVTVVNAGVLPHSVTAMPVAALVAIGGTRKLLHLRERRRASLTWRAGWEWLTVEGAADLIGPDDPLPGFDPAGLPRLLRDIFTSAGGTHDDWPTYDRVMAQERRVAVLITPDRVYGSPT